MKLRQRFNICYEPDLPCPFLWVGKFLITWSWYDWSIGYYPDYENSKYRLTYYKKEVPCYISQLGFTGNVPYLVTCLNSLSTHLGPTVSTAARTFTWLMACLSTSSGFTGPLRAFFSGDPGAGSSTDSPGGSIAPGATKLSSLKKTMIACRSKERK